MARKLKSTALQPNQSFTGNYITIPSGSTAQRPASAAPGMIRYNTDTGYFETYTNAGWGAIATPPSITTVSPTTYNGEQGTLFTITGSFFDPSAIVKFITTQGVEYSAAITTYVNSGQLTATTPQDFTVANEPLSVKVTNGSGLSVVLSGVIDCGGTPTWNTAAGTIATCYDIMRSGFTTSISATDPDSAATISYSIVSGSLPTGMSLNASTGAITGTPNAVVSDTTYTFTARVTDNAGNTNDRTFSVIVKAPITTVYSFTGADQTFAVPAGLTKLQTYMWAGAGGGASGEGYTDPGGAGGYSEGLINLTGMSTLVMQVGQGGTYGRSTRPYPAGGLPAVRSSYVSGAGGGRSAIFNGSVSFSNALIVAGGGGGAAGHGGGATSRGSQGGAGGGTTGESGYSSYVSVTPNGATQTAAGTQSSKAPYNGLSSAALQGGDAGDGTGWSTGWNQAGGGGDGYYGGGAIDNQHQGGGGGSGWYHPTLVSAGVTSSNPSNTNAVNLGPLNPPQTGSTYYAAGIGVGNNNAAGGNGRLVIKY